MADIFVSYSHKDAEFGRRLHTALVGQKRDVWMDWEDIPFSADWWTEIKQGIEASDNFLIILSNDFISSPVCMLEVAHARNNNKRMLIISRNLTDFGTASNALEQRVKSSATLQTLLADRDITAIARENWGTIGHVNWLVFNDDDDFDESFRLLSQTLDTDLEHIRGHTHLQVKAIDWENNNRNWSFLLTGVQIDNSETWLKTAEEKQKEPQPTDLHREFIKASREQHDEQEAYHQRMQTRAKQLRRVSMIAGIIATIITIAGIALTAWTSIQVANQQVTVAAADEQIAMVGDTLTPIANSLIEAENALFDAEEQVGMANTQAADAEIVAQQAETQVGEAHTQAAEAEIVAQQAETQVQVANVRVESANATLTPVAIALTEGAIAQEDAQTEIADVQNIVATANFESTISAQDLIIAATDIQNISIQVQEANSTVESANATLTPVAIALTEGAIAQEDALIQVAVAENQAEEAHALSTNSAQQLGTADAQIVEVSTQIQVANSTVDSANATLTPIGPTLTQAGEDIANANLQVTEAAVLVVDAETKVADAGTQVVSAQNEAEQANAASTEAAQQVGTADVQIAVANATVDSANATLTPIGPTLTQAGEALAIANLQVTEAAILLVNAGTQVADASTQVISAQNEAAAANAVSTDSAQQLGTADAQIEVADATVNSANATLTPIGPTLTQAGEDLVFANLQVTEAAVLVLEAETQVVDAETLVADANFLIATADNEVGTAEAKAQIVEATSAAIALTAEFSSNQAQSQSLIVNAEQAALNGDIDLALALVLESYEINPNLAQTRRLLNDIAYSSARFIFDDKPFVVFSPDSGKIAYPELNEIVIVDIDTRTEVMRLRGHSDLVTSGDFSSDGQFFVSGSKDTNVLVWDLNSGSIERDTLVDHTGAIVKVAYDPSGTRIVSIAEDEKAIIWRVDLSYSPTEFVANPGTVLTDVAFIGDGSRFIVWGQDGQNEIIHNGNIGRGSFNRQIDNIIRTLNTGDSNFQTRYGMTDAEARIIIYDLVSINEIPFSRGFTANDRFGIRALNSAGNQAIVSFVRENDDGTSTNNLVLLDVNTREWALEYQGEGKERVTALAYSPDRETVLSGFGRYLILWDANTGIELKRFGAHLDDVVEITFSADSNRAISRSRDGNIRVWDVDNTDPSVLLQIESESGDAAAHPSFSPDNTLVFFSVQDNVYRYNADTLREIQSPFSYFDLNNIFYSSSQPYAVTSSESIARMWNATLPPLEAALWGENTGGESGETIDPIGTFSTDGNWLAISMSRYVRAYDVRSACCPQSPIRFDRTGMDVAGLAFSPDNRYLYIAVNTIDNAEHYAIIQWNLETRETVVIDMPHIRPIRAIDLSNDGRRLLSASEDQTIVLWNIEQGILLRRLAGHRDNVNFVYFGGTETTALSASDDATLILWDLRSGQSIRRFAADNAVTGMSINNEGTMAISTDGSNLVTLWAIETLEEVIDWVKAHRDIPPLTSEQCSQFDVQC